MGAPLEQPLLKALDTPVGSRTLGPRCELPRHSDDRHPGFNFQNSSANVTGSPGIASQDGIELYSVAELHACTCREC